MPCACGRPFVPDVDLYHAHVQTAEHQRWRIETIERGRKVPPDEMAYELFGLVLPRENAPAEVVREAVPCASVK